jgi:hypothetical protein
VQGRRRRRRGQGRGAKRKPREVWTRHFFFGHVPAAHLSPPPSGPSHVQFARPPAGSACAQTSPCARALSFFIHPRSAKTMPTGLLPGDAPAAPILFFIYTALGVVLFLSSIYAARRHADTVGFVLAPLLSLALVWENLSLAVAATTDAPLAAGVLALRGSVASFIIPLFLVTLFELNYTVHKRRSANFFCITFDQGHRRGGGGGGAAAASSSSSSGASSATASAPASSSSSSSSSSGGGLSVLSSSLLRYSMWFLGVATLLVQVTLNAPFTADPLAAPRTARFTFKGLSLGNAAGTGQGGVVVGPDSSFAWQEAVDFFPWLLLLSFALYSGLSLWRYGTTMSTDVRASALNPWGAVFVAASGLTVAWLLSPSSWPVPYATNLFELLLAASVVVTIRLVEGNLRTLEAWERILAISNDYLRASEVDANARREQAEAMLRSQQLKREEDRRRREAHRQQLQQQQQLVQKMQQHVAAAAAGGLLDAGRAAGQGRRTDTAAGDDEEEEGAGGGGARRETRVRAALQAPAPAAPAAAATLGAGVHAIVVEVRGATPGV